MISHGPAINLAAAKARLSELVDRAEAGESIPITRRGKVVARLVPGADPQPPRETDLSWLREGLRGQPMTTDLVTILREMRDAH